MMDNRERSEVLRAWYTDRHCKCCRRSEFEIDRDVAFEEKIEFELNEAEERGRGHGRGRFVKCRGCPTVECTCFTDLEHELLYKTPAQQAVVEKE